MVDRDELQFTEEMGAFFERSGSPRMAGRVWGYLLIVDTEQVSAVDLAEALDASPSSISTATRLLLGLGLLDRIRMPGERREYFTIHHGAILNLVRYQLEALTPKRMAARALELFGEREVARPHLDELHEVYTWFADEFAALMDRFPEERAQAPQRE